MHPNNQHIVTCSVKKMPQKAKTQHLHNLVSKHFTCYCHIHNHPTANSQNCHSLLNSSMTSLLLFLALPSCSVLYCLHHVVFLDFSMFFLGYLPYPWQQGRLWPELVTFLEGFTGELEKNPHSNCWQETFLATQVSNASQLAGFQNVASKWTRLFILFLTECPCVWVPLKAIECDSIPRNYSVMSFPHSGTYCWVAKAAWWQSAECSHCLDLKQSGGTWSRSRFLRWFLFPGENLRSFQSVPWSCMWALRKGFWRQGGGWADAVRQGSQTTGTIAVTARGA